MSVKDSRTINRERADQELIWTSKRIIKKMKKLKKDYEAEEKKKKKAATAAAAAKKKKAEVQQRKDEKAAAGWRRNGSSRQRKVCGPRHPYQLPPNLYGAFWGYLDHASYTAHAENS